MKTEPGYLVAKTENDKIFTYWNEKIKPNGEDYMFTQKIGFDEVDDYFDKVLYESDLTKWNASIIKAEVNDELKKYILIEFVNITGKVDFDSQLQQGIDISSLWDSIKINKHCVEGFICHLKGCVDAHIYTATLKSIEEKPVVEDKESINDNNIDSFIKKYISNLPENWRGDLDMYLAMKNSMIEAISFTEKYILSTNQQSTEQEWISVDIEPEFGGEYNVVYDLEDGGELVTSTMDYEKLTKLWMDTRGANIPIHTVKLWMPLPNLPKAK